MKKKKRSMIQSLYDHFKLTPKILLVIFKSEFESFNYY